MKFKLPETLAGLTIEELSALLDQIAAERTELLSTPDEDLTDEQIADASELMGARAAVQEEIAAVEAAVTEREAQIAALRADAEAADAPADETDADAEDKDKADADAEAKELESVTASAAAAARRSVVARAASRTKTAEPVAPQAPAARASLVAAANVPGIEAGAALSDMGAVAEAFMARSRSFANTPRGTVERFDRYGVMSIQKPETEFTFTGGTLEEQLAFINNAASEKRLAKGSLVASGGWCAPSETLYDFCSMETVSGILSIPEITVRRGGISFTKGPDYASLAATWGFLQTEAQAEAGTAKVCYDVECPDFEEVRLDAIGFCVKNGILTNVGYPELVKRVLEIGAVAHAHKVNAQVISRISAKIGAATVFTAIGGTMSDILDAVNLQAVVLRYQYAMDENATIEAVFPLWAKEIARSDLSRRNGVNMLAVTDAEINAFLGVRNIAAQWVYDYQPIATTGPTVGQAWPTTLEVLLYPAGAFVKGTTDVISLDTVYDSVGLSTNTYTAAFFEEGLFVANTCASGRKVSISLLGGLEGLTGAANIGLVTTP